MAEGDSTDPNLQQEAKAIVELHDKNEDKIFDFCLKST